MEYPYESLSYMARLEFKDAHGLEALFHCYQRLRVLSPELFCVAHRVWGSGDQYHTYAAPGTQLVSRVPEDGKDLAISTLDRPARAGDIIELHSVRRIHHGFKNEREAWEYTPYTPTANARVAISFPVGREPERINVGASSGTRSPFVSRPGTKELLFKVTDPSVRSLYRVEWSW